MVYVYILRCAPRPGSGQADGGLYVGLTEDLEGRERAHNEGRGATYTFLRRPVKLVYSEPHERLEDAVHRERQLKGWSRAKKEALIAGDMERLRQLSRRRPTP